MGSLPFAVSFFLLFAVSQAQIINYRFKAFSDKTTCTDEPTGLVQICLNATATAMCFDGESIGVMSCPASTPNCDGGQCTNQPPSVDFKCPSDDGYYPDPSNCAKYYICVRQIPNLEICPAGSVYSAASHSCARRSLNNCYTIDCTKKEFGPIVYQGDRTMYGVCKKNTLAGIRRCEAGFEMDPKDQQCKVACKVDGNVPKLSDATQTGYYQCLPTTNGYDAVEKKCPNNSIFDQNKLYCVTVPVTNDRLSNSA